MLFTEPAFLFAFLPVTLAGYFLLRPQVQNAWLLIASLFFYLVGEPRWAWIIAGSIGLNYVLGLVLGVRREGPWRRVVLTVGVVANLVPLALFKGADAFFGSVAGHFGTAVPSAISGNGGLRLPLGLSFYTFHGISYLVDVYRRTASPVRRPVDFGLYIAVFPQLIAGPIVRYSQVATQLPGRVVTMVGFAEGTRRFIIGLGKKMLIANTVGVRADAIFALPASQLSSATAWIGLVCYALQIYFDFSGYSDMAVGLGRMFGFRFPENFDHPYAATSVGEFWRRWHMTLTAWFRDYVYIPLGGNRAGPWRTYANILVVFFLSAIWHRPSLMFLARGAFFATLLILERVAAKRLGWRVPRVVGHAYLILVVLFGWVLFRSDSWAQASSFLGAMVGAQGEAPTFSAAFLLSPDVLLALLAGILGSFPWMPAVREWWSRAHYAPPLGRGWGLADVGLWVGELGFLGSVLGASLLSAAASSYSPFLYFRF
jgi:alginate O-acetyltransferase complex protein AlgI